MKNTEGLPCGRGLAAPESLSFVVSFFYHSLDFVCKHSNCLSFRFVIIRVINTLHKHVATVNLVGEGALLMAMESVL